MGRADILIVGQGLAGTLLGWELEQTGISVAILDDGHARAASSVAAGIINPITGRRLVKSWSFETLFPLACEAYRELEKVLGVPIWHEMRVRRVFADERERAIGAECRKRAELASYIESTDEKGWWVRDAARVDLVALLSSARERWLRSGKLHTETVGVARMEGQHDLVIDCRGVVGAKSLLFSFVPWEFSKGELLEIDVDGLEPGVILNSRQWIAPVRPGAALAGATHEPGVCDCTTTALGRTAIERVARDLLGQGRAFSVTGQRVGVRVHAPDKRPVAGRHPDRRGVGLVNGLGGKGALWAPMLARRWVKHITAGAAFGPEIDVGRFAKTTTSST